jgi:hypothetical protein
VTLLRVLLSTVVGLVGTVGSGVAPATAVHASAAHTYDGRAAARYALHWSRTAGHPVPGGDGTAFVSETLAAGGWNRRGGTDPDAPLAWTPDLAGRHGPSATWTRADRLYRFAVEHTGRAVARRPATPADDWATVWTLTAGDLVFVDRESDGVVDRALVVVGRDTVLGFTEPTVSQRSPDRHDVPMSAWIKAAALRDPAMTLHPVVPRPSYVDP